MCCGIPYAHSSPLRLPRNTSQPLRRRRAHKWLPFWAQPHPTPFLMFSWANCQMDHGVDNIAASAISHVSWHLMTHTTSKTFISPNVYKVQCKQRTRLTDLKRSTSKRSRSFVLLCYPITSVHNSK
jgi:hypothetical protein